MQSLLRTSANDCRTLVFKAKIRFSIALAFLPTAILLADQYGPTNRHPFVWASVVECAGYFLAWNMCCLLILTESMTSQPHNYALPCFWIVSLMCKIINFLLNQKLGYSGNATSDVVYYLLTLMVIAMEFYLAVSGVFGQDTAGYEVYQKPGLTNETSFLFYFDAIVNITTGLVHTPQFCSVMSQTSSHRMES